VFDNDVDDNKDRYITFKNALAFDALFGVYKGCMRISKDIEMVK